MQNGGGTSEQVRSDKFLREGDSNAKAANSANFANIWAFRGIRSIRAIRVKNLWLQLRTRSFYDLGIARGASIHRIARMMPPAMNGTGAPNH